MTKHAQFKQRFWKFISQLLTLSFVFCSLRIKLYSGSYTVSGKKDTRMFFLNIFYKISTILVKCGILFAKSCKRFPPHLNNICTLSCDTWNAHLARATIELSDKVTPKFIPPQLCLPNSPDLNPFDYSVWEYCERTCTKRQSLIWSWRMAAAMWSTSVAHSVLSCCFSSSRSVMHILNTSSCNIPHAV